MINHGDYHRFLLLVVNILRSVIQCFGNDDLEKNMMITGAISWTWIHSSSEKKKKKGCLNSGLWVEVENYYDNETIGVCGMLWFLMERRLENKLVNRSTYNYSTRESLQAVFCFERGVFQLDTKAIICV